MTRDEILAMPAGREMDALVAEHVMGLLNVHKYNGEWIHTRNPIPFVGAPIVEYYSTDIAAAWEVVDKIMDPKLMTREMFERMSNSKFGYWWDDARIWAMTAQEAAHWISQHALLAVMDEA